MLAIPMAALFPPPPLPLPLLLRLLQLLQLLLLLRLFAPPTGRQRRRKEEARARLICILDTWCHRCVRRFGDDKLVICVPPSGPKGQKCGRCSAAKHRCEADPTSTHHQQRLRYQVVLYCRLFGQRSPRGVWYNAMDVFAKDRLAVEKAFIADHALQVLIAKRFPGLQTWSQREVESDLSVSGT